LYNSTTYFDAFYMTIITLSTVGFEEFIPVSSSTKGKVFTIGLITLGMGNLIYVLTALNTYIINGTVQRFIRRKKMIKEIKRMSKHIIVCGAGTMGCHVIKQLYQSNHPFVVIENDQNTWESIRKKYPSVQCLIGDATSDSLLGDAGVQKAKSIAAVLSSDKDNLFLSISAKYLNPNISVFSKVIDLKNSNKLIRAGVSSLIPPEYLGGIRLASEITKPYTVDFIDNLMDSKNLVKIEKLFIPSNAWIVGKTLQEIDFTNKTGCQVIAFQSEATGIYNLNPTAKDIVEANTNLLFFATIEKSNALQKFISLTP